MGLLIFLVLVGVPIVEITVFIEVGGRIGLWSTLTLIVATAVVGTALLRRQGLATLASARATVNRGGIPVREVLDGVCLLVAGALLLTPGFVTDAIGGLLLIPVVRAFLLRQAIDRLAASGNMSMGGGGGPGFNRPDDVIDGDYTVMSDEDEGEGGDESDRRPRLQSQRKRKVP